MTPDGGYDAGYQACPCFWGTEPGSLVSALVEMVGSVHGLRVLDAGCGEGKNAQFLARLGAEVVGYDISTDALANSARFDLIRNVKLLQGDVRQLAFSPDTLDVVLMYGLLHCFRSAAEVSETVGRLKKATRAGGAHVVCTFNSRQQDLTAHPGFTPLLLPHLFFVDLYKDWTIVLVSDTDLAESHPHNNIPHVHSMTRLIARRVQ